MWLEQIKQAKEMLQEQFALVVNSHKAEQATLDKMMDIVRDKHKKADALRQQSAESLNKKKQVSFCDRCRPATDCHTTLVCRADNAWLLCALQRFIAEYVATNNSFISKCKTVTKVDAKADGMAKMMATVCCRLSRYIDAGRTVFSTGFGDAHYM
jgi:hypothetical protein